MALWLLWFIHETFSFSVKCFCNGCKMTSLERQIFFHIHVFEHPHHLLWYDHTPQQAILIVVACWWQRGSFSSPKLTNYRQAAKKLSVDISESHTAFEEHTIVVEPCVQKSNCAQGKLHVERSVSQELFCYWIQRSSELPKSSLRSSVHLAAGPILMHHLTHIEMLASERARILPLKG